MKHTGHRIKEASFASSGITDAVVVHWNLTTAELYTAALQRGEAELAHLGPLVVDTGRYTGRSPKDKYIVRDATTEDTVAWGSVNQPMAPEHFEALRQAALATTQGLELFVADVFVGAQPEFRVPVRVITEYAWHSLFIRNLFVRPTVRAHETFEPVYTILDLPSLRADPDTMGTRSETVIALNLSEKLVIIGSTEYAGEMKKAAFSMMNFELPARDVLPMHCSANVGPDNEVALFFGLSGTGKTTLSSTSERTLIGDDEHGWSDRGVFNFEGGCYAKIEHLSSEAEPEIYQTTRRFGTILENVIVDRETRRVNLDDTSKTENTRAAYPITHIPSASRVGFAGQPAHVVFLTADAFGVLPPIARLSAEQAMYYFLSGYTAKLAGTERGVTEPQATFSICFGGPFMPRPAVVYAELLASKVRDAGASVWLVNTGWTGGPFGEGHRMPISYTRSMVEAAVSSRLDHAEFTVEPAFGLAVPAEVPGVRQDVLLPRGTWSDPEAYDAQARKVARMFRDNFRRFEDQVAGEVAEAGPRA
ncbi:MAG: phosphoenolpyruvate carboxykinase [Deinococcales bacterium]